MSDTTAETSREPHRNTQTQKLDVNVYQVAPGFFAYTSSLAVDTDGSDPDPDRDHQNETAWQDDDGNQLGAHHVPYYVWGMSAPTASRPASGSTTASTTSPASSSR
jgi:hypothetical protein